MQRIVRLAWPVISVFAILLAIVTSVSKPIRNEPGHFADPAKFEFQIVESFDAHYLGDTPAHKGRHGLNGRMPNMALGDPVHRGDEVIGHVTSMVWDRTKDSMEVEFDPEPKIRISIGETVWIAIGENPPK